MFRETRRRLALLAWLPIVASCGPSISRSAHTFAPVSPSVPEASLSSDIGLPVAPVPSVDPVLALIGRSDEHFAAGRRYLELGHVGGAKSEFDRSVEVLIESSYGGRMEPRIREHFDRLIDRISTYELKALAEGDGFTEKQYEPASIDELLALSATLAPPSEPEPLESVQPDAPAGDHDVPVPFNQRVRAFIALFQGRLHEFLEEGMKRGSRYLPMIQSVFRAEGLPLDLAYVPLVESAFKPNAVSRAKAKGVWQFMRGTGVENGLRQDWYIDERSDPEKATVAAAKYLATLASLFHGDWHLALASYNGGPGRVQRAIKASRHADFWALAAKPRLLPRETRDYVPMILAAIAIARNPAQYGFSFESEAPHTYETVTLSGPVDLRHVAEWVDTTIDDIRMLNPELRRWTTPVRDSGYELKVPVGTAAIVRERLDSVAAAELTSLNWYTVKPGQTLASIARQLRVSRTDLAEANYLKASSRVTPGQQLVVPREATALMAARTERAVPAADARPLPGHAAVPVVDPSGAEQIRVLYRVKRGDTLASIARIFRTSVASLQAWNRLRGTRIRAGQRLTIYTDRAD